MKIYKEYKAIGRKIGAEIIEIAKTFVIFYTVFTWDQQNEIEEVPTATHSYYLNHKLGFPLCFHLICF